MTISGGRGSEKKKYLYGKTRHDVAKKLTVAMKAVQDSVPLPSDRLTVATFAKDWLAGVRLSTLKPKTQESYEGAIRIHLIPNLGHIKLAKLTATHLESLYGNLIQSGYSAKSIRIYHACFFAMLEKGVRQNKVVRNEASLVDLPRLTSHELPMWTIREMSTPGWLRPARSRRSHPREHQAPSPTSPVRVMGSCWAWSSTGPGTCSSL